MSADCNSQAPSYHLLFEAALVIGIFWLVFTKTYKPKRKHLTQKEKEALVAEWEPEPLAPEVSQDHPFLLNLHSRIIDSKIGKYLSINGKRCLNLTSLNFLGILGCKKVEESAIKALRQYGVGACGPRGFYGTVDVHLDLEDWLSEFLGCEEVASYPYGYAVMASVIPAYFKKGDVIFCDEAACFSIQKGILASRSTVKYFKHNDMQHLESLLEEQEREDIRDPKKAKVTRRLLVVEGIYYNTGDICPLPQLIEFKWKYKLRIFLDESVSFGVLGKTGRGVTEYYGVPREDIDLLCASLETCLASLGGFSCGKSYIVDHQRLSGLGYAFSCSQPPMNAAVAITALQLMKDNPEMLVDLENKCRTMHRELSKLERMHVVGVEISPVKHLWLTTSSGDRHTDLAILRKIVAEAESRGVALAMAHYLDHEETFSQQPSIRISVNRELTEEEIASGVQVLSEACDTVLIAAAQ